MKATILATLLVVSSLTAGALSASADPSSDAARMFFEELQRSGS